MLAPETKYRNAVDLRWYIGSKRGFRVNTARHTLDDAPRLENARKMNASSPSLS